MRGATSQVRGQRSASSRSNATRRATATGVNAACRRGRRRRPSPPRLAAHVVVVVAATAAASRCPTRAGEQPLEAARRLIDAGDFGAAAFHCYDIALRATPDHRLHYEVAVAAYQIGDSPRLQKQLRAAIRLAPTYSEPPSWRALQTDGRAAETEHHLREAARFARARTSR